ncbi:MAG: glycosyltransferase involved in cell wall biosynthesis [Clostridium sp.]|jgi:glycosyltransferase involved in cell wall biosynthesis
MNNYPKVSIVIPTYNEEFNIDRCLKSIRNQNYDQNKIDIYISDGLSEDKTIEIAKKYNVYFVVNHQRDAQIGKAVGIAKVDRNSDYFILIDADNEIKDNKWLYENINLLEINKQCFAADANFIVNSSDTAINRISILMVTEDPIVRHISNLRKNSIIKDKGNYEIRTIKNNTFPAFGANGFIWRAEVFFDIFDKIDTNSFDEADIASLVVQNGYKDVLFYKDSGIFHHHISSLAGFIKKRIRSGKEFIERSKRKEKTGTNDIIWTKRYSSLRLIYTIMYNFTFIGPIIESFTGYRKSKDLAWFLYPLLCFIAVVVYGITFIVYHPKDSRPQVVKKLEKEKYD